MQGQRKASRFRMVLCITRKGSVSSRTLNTARGMAFNLLHFLKVMTGLNSPHGWQVSRWWFWTSQTLEKGGQDCPVSTGEYETWDHANSEITLRACPRVHANPSVSRLLKEWTQGCCDFQILSVTSVRSSSEAIQTIWPGRSQENGQSSKYKSYNRITIYLYFQKGNENISLCALGSAVSTFQIGHWLIGLG